jgi:hypothetical protein
MGIDGSSRSSNASGDPQGKNRKPREMNGKVIALRSNIRWCSEPWSSPVGMVRSSVLGLRDSQDLVGGGKRQEGGGVCHNYFPTRFWRFFPGHLFIATRVAFSVWTVSSAAWSTQIIDCDAIDRQTCPFQEPGSGAIGVLAGFETPHSWLLGKRREGDGSQTFRRSGKCQDPANDVLGIFKTQRRHGPVPTLKTGSAKRNPHVGCAQDR